jgi:hypothetical protein
MFVLLELCVMQNFIPGVLASWRDKILFLVL